MALFILRQRTEGTANTVSSLTKLHLSVLVAYPLTNFQKASEKLREHFTGIGSNSAKKSHLAAVEMAANFKAVMEKRQVPITVMDSVLKKIVRRFNQLLRRLFSVIGKAFLFVDTVTMGKLLEKTLIIMDCITPVPNR